MQFVIYRGENPPQRKDVQYPFVSLYQDNWNDFSIRCRFEARLHVNADLEIELGPVRIVVDGKPFHVTVRLPAVFDGLESPAALGESIAYYRRLRDEAPREVMEAFVAATGDVVFNPENIERVPERVWSESFLREASSRHALRRGGFYFGHPVENAKSPAFKFEVQLPDALGPHQVDLDFSQHEALPNRVILMVGRNGTGKTQVLASLAKKLVPPQRFDPASINDIPDGEIDDEDVEISRLIAISYNIFDEFPLPKQGGKVRVPSGAAYRSRGSYKYCGLRTSDGVLKISQVAKMIAETLEPVVVSDRRQTLRRVLSSLLNPATVEALVSPKAAVRDPAVRALSAGQRLLAAIVSNIVGFIEEGSLLLIDEPETNLHPGLLTSFMSALNQVLEEFDSYAVIASHSPILLQQVPARYVRKFTRDLQDEPGVAPLNFESFGEDLGELTRRVLGLTEPERDFTAELERLFKVDRSAERVAARFEHGLPYLAMAHLYDLEENREEEGGQE